MYLIQINSKTVNWSLEQLRIKVFLSIPFLWDTLYTRFDVYMFILLSLLLFLLSKPLLMVCSLIYQDRNHLIFIDIIGNSLNWYLVAFLYLHCQGPEIQPLILVYTSCISSCQPWQFWRVKWFSGQSIGTRSWPEYKIVVLCLTDKTSKKPSTSHTFS